MTNIDESLFKLKFNEENRTASIVGLQEETKNIFVPRSISHYGQDYTIISIGKNAFCDFQYESITFDKDSEVEIFKSDSFLGSKIDNLEIPSNLKKIKGGSFFQTMIVNFKISPKNKIFSYVDNKYLVGKSDENLETFDQLIYSKFDLREAVIPSYIKVLKEHSFSSSLDTLIFPDDTEIESIEYGSLSEYLTDLRIPKTLKKIDQSCFQLTERLVNIEISPENKEFLYIDNKYLLKKRKCEDFSVFSKIAFCRRDVVDVKIPSYITKIADNAFSKCEKMRSIIFEPNSKLEIIDTDAFSWSLGPTTLIIPESVKHVCGSAFVRMRNIAFVEFLGDKLHLDHGIFHLCHNLKVISLPNATKVVFRKTVDDNAVVFIKSNAKIKGDIFIGK